MVWSTLWNTILANKSLIRTTVFDHFFPKGNMGFLLPNIKNLWLTFHTLPCGTRCCEKNLKDIFHEWRVLTYLAEGRKPRRVRINKTHRLRSHFGLINGSECLISAVKPEFKFIWNYFDNCNTNKSNTLDVMWLSLSCSLVIFCCIYNVYTAVWSLHGQHYSLDTALSAWSS